MAKTICVVNTKGGEGKTTLSSGVLPAVAVANGYDLNEINIYEIDDNNNSSYEQSSLNYKFADVKKGEDFIDDVVFDLDTDQNTLNIIDSGGGNDTKSVLNFIKSSELFGIEYAIPVNDAINHIQNAIDTVKMIKSNEEELVNTDIEIEYVQKKRG